MVQKSTPELIIEAAPDKKIYKSIIADYDLKTAICELIDNSIDAWYTNTIRGGF